MRQLPRTVLVVATALVAAWAPSASQAVAAALPHSLAPSSTVKPRQQLTAAQLRQGFAYAEPVSLEAYGPAPGAGRATHRFEGRLTLQGMAGAGGSRVYTDRYAVAVAADSPVRHLPDFSFELVQVDAALVPVRRGAVAGDHPYWEWILEPGRVWQEAGDGGWSRAALPFSLEEVNENCVHNGVLTFLFRPGGAMSRVAYQVSSETCAYFKVDLWGVVDARLAPGKVADRDAVARAYRQEVAARLPRKAIETLAVDYPGVNPANFGHPADVTPADMTTWGVVVDGVHYTGGCPTRAGPYPFCEVLDLPSYSVAKSIFASAALMRLERLDPGARSLRVTDYVPECAANGRWSGVTFEHLSDMASGLYDSPVPFADESAARTVERFFLPVSHRDKIDYACNSSPRQEEPGRRSVYRTVDTYILGTALNARLRRTRGAGSDIFDDVVVHDLWRPLQLSPVTKVSRRTRDEVAQPFAGFGLVLQADDVAKLGQFFSPLNDAADAVLDRGMRRAALQLEPADRGLPAGTADSMRYNNGFWALPVADLPGCAQEQFIPYLSGFGGVSIVLLPNGVTYYYFSDNDEYRFRRAIDEAAAIRRYCQPRDTTSRPTKAKPR